MASGWSSLDGEGPEERDAASNASGAVCSTAELPDHMVCVDDPEEMLDPRANNPFFNEIVVTHAVALLCGVLGNGIVVTVMVGERKARTATNLFLGSLAAADLLLLLVYGPLEALQYFVTQWDEAGAVCKLARGAQLLSASASVLNLAAVTLERFLVIVFPMKSRPYCTLSNCRRAVVVVWVVAALLTAPVFLTKGTHRMVYTNLVTNVTLYHCNETGLIFAVYQFIILFGAPGILMIICYSFVIRELWRSTRSMRVLTNTASMKNKKNNKCCDNHSHHRRISSPYNADTSANNDIEMATHSICAGETPSRATSKQFKKGDDVRKARKQVIKMLILVVVLFLACWGPRIIMEILFKVGIQTYSILVYRIRIAIFLLPAIHACMNPIIYSFMSRNFRRSLKGQCKRLRCESDSTVTSVSGTHGSAYGSSVMSRMKREASAQGGFAMKPRKGTTRSSVTSNANYRNEVTKQTDLESADV